MRKRSGKAGNPGKIAAALQYWAVMALYGLLGFTPLWFATRLARAMADAFRIFDGKHALRAETAMRERLGLDDAAAKRLARENYRHYGYTAMELFRLARMSPDAALARIDMGNAIAEALSAKDEGRGVMMLTGHLGNWEWCGFGFGMYLSVEGVIARPLANPRIDAFMRRLRERAGFEVWSRFGAIRRLFKALSGGCAAGALVDQDGGPRGLPGEFLGRSCTSMTIPIEVAVKVGSPMMVAALFRDREPMRFVARAKPLRRADPEADPEAEVRRLSREVNDDLGDLIREFPEQWIWGHQRWRHGETGK